MPYTQVDAVLDILLDDLGDAAEAIAFLETLPRKRWGVQGG